MVEQSDIINKFIVPLLEQEFYQCQRYLDETLEYRRNELSLQGRLASGANIEITRKEYEKDLETRQKIILSIVQDVLNAVEGEPSKKTVQELKEFTRSRLSSHIQELENKLREHVSGLGIKPFSGLELGAERILSAFEVKLELILRTPVQPNNASSASSSFVDPKRLSELRSVPSINNAATTRESSTPAPLSTSPGMHRIFLCHANEDKPQVREVYHRLKTEGFEPWLDEEDLLPGQLWDQEIRKALKASDFILIFFSQTSVAKRGYVQREMKLALETWEEIPEGQIHTIPVRLDACTIPERFKPFQRVDLFDERGFERIVTAIRFELGRRRQLEGTGQETYLAAPENFTEHLSFGTIDDTSVYHDKRREVICFTMLVEDELIVCGITLEALADYFGADFREPLPGFNGNKERIAQLATERIRQGQLENDGSILIKSRDI